MTVPSGSHSESPSSDSLYELVEQLTERLHRGEVVDLSEVMAAHPQHAERLQQVLPALAVLADVHDASSIAAPVAAGSVRSATDEVSGMLGDFRLVREIGRGGMGVVYEARQISLDRRVALKVLPFAGVLDARQLQRFTNEARAAAGLHHANIVPVYAVGCERGVHYYAMQYIDGQTLADVIREMRPASGGRGTDSKRIGPAGAFKVADDFPFNAVGHAEEITNIEIQTSKEVPSSKIELHDALPVTDHNQCDSDVQPTGGLTARRSPDASTLRILDKSQPARQRFRTIANWGIQIAEALDYAHSVGVIHRDIKPANIMLDSQGRVWITDFGLAQIETDAGLTMTGDIVGTLRYMSPEQALGERGLVDQRTDVYSLGLSLYEMLTLKPAFGDANRRELLQRISADDPISLRRINSAIPIELETIIQKATEKETADRYATAGDLAGDLRRYLDERPIKARPATRLDRLRKWTRRNRVLVNSAFAALALTVVILAASTAWVVQERNVARDAEISERQQTILAAQRQRAAERAQHLAENRRREAQAALDESREVVENMLSRVAEGAFDRPNMEPLRKQLLEQALVFYERFVQDDSDRAEALLEKGKAYRRLAWIRTWSNQQAESLAMMRRAVAIHRPLYENLPDDSRIATVLAESERDLALQWLKVGNKDEAARSFSAAYQVSSRLVASLPNYRPGRAIFVMNASDLAWSMMRRREVAAPNFDRALVLCLEARRSVEQLVQDDPNDYEFQLLLPRTVGNLCAALLGTGRPPDEVENVYQKGCDCARAIARRFPDRQEGQNILTGVLSDFADFLELHAGKRDEAEGCLTEVITARRTLRATYPVRHTVRLADSLAQYGRFLRRQGRLDEAIAALREAASIYEDSELLAEDGEMARTLRADVLSDLAAVSEQRDGPRDPQ